MNRDHARLLALIVACSVLGPLVALAALWLGVVGALLAVDTLNLLIN